MKDLGEKLKDTMYDSLSMPNSEKVRYPEISLPLSVIEGLNLKVNDEVTVSLKGRISGMEDTKWSKRVTIEATQGEVSKKTKDKKDNSVLSEA